MLLRDQACARLNAGQMEQVRFTKCTFVYCKWTADTEAAAFGQIDGVRRLTFEKAFVSLERPVFNCRHRT